MDWKNKIEEMKNPPITIEQTCKELEVSFDRYAWFYSCVIEGKSICVYVHEMGKEVSDLIPDRVYGYQIKIGFASYLTCGDKYGKNKLSFDILNHLEEIE